MSSNDADLAIRVSGLGKSYRITHGLPRATTLGEAVLRRLKNPLARPGTESFWALRDVDLTVNVGEVVGIVGRNGAGKSTLLKILSRITAPTTGRIDLYGRVGSLLEVGTGFHPELTGRENIYLNGQILGMKRREITRQFDAIVDFSGTQRFLDTPVKRYSSGMYVRLAFAVAAHLNPEILIVDEVLAVGDQQFQAKCLGKMKDVAHSGRTVLFVSHNMQAVSQLCNKGVYMRDGAVDFAGDIGEAVRRYVNFTPPAAAADTLKRRPGSGEFRFARFEVDKQVYLSTDPMTIECDVIPQNLPGKSRPGRYFISLEVVNPFGLTILHLDSRLLGIEFDSDAPRRIRYQLPCPRLAQGDYTINAFLCHTGGVADAYDSATRLNIAPILPYPAVRGDCADSALVYPEFSIEQAELAEAQVAGSELGGSALAGPELVEAGLGRARTGDGDGSACDGDGPTDARSHACAGTQADAARARSTAPAMSGV